MLCGDHKMCLAALCTTSKTHIEKHLFSNANDLIFIHKLSFLALTQCITATGSKALAAKL